MYLSQLKLNPTQPEARRDLGDAYQMHRTLARAFAPDAASEIPRFLWRLERERSPGEGNKVLVQAQTGARWAGLEALPGYLLAGIAEKVVDLDRLIVEGSILRFRLRANPAVKRDGKRWGLHDEQEQLDWLRRQGARVGFAVVGADMSQHERLRATQRRSGMLITVDSVQFDGQLRVLDAVALRNAVGAGLGPGKALGLGMLSLAPI
ncbi:MAG: type I-E CRISPR-associated protein Cas6/Cse3/CasE [Aquabacterium sp.]|nr:type I-E CRISPR-associated protein Cas6/Cse3/CasE [Aquabacterium sp.]